MSSQCFLVLCILLNVICVIIFRLIFKHRVITKSILGRDVQFDMGKFKVRKKHVIFFNINSITGKLCSYFVFLIWLEF